MTAAIVSPSHDFLPLMVISVTDYSTENGSKLEQQLGFKVEHLLTLSEAASIIDGPMCLHQ